MSGIVVFCSQEEPISQTHLKRSLDALSHQGLNRQNIWISENQKVSLGYTKLSMIDDMGGEQPLSDGERTRYIVADGEFYDLGSVQQQLQQQGYSFQTHSSSEIVLHLYNQLGTQCLDKLRGEFAFAIWDERNQLLFAARDRFGVKPQKC